jgi:hypothetical protein
LPLFADFPGAMSLELSLAENSFVHHQAATARRDYLWIAPKTKVDSPSSPSRDTRTSLEKLPTRRRGAQPLGLARGATELIHVIARQRVRQHVPDVDKLGH